MKGVDLWTWSNSSVFEWYQEFFHFTK